MWIYLLQNIFLFSKKTRIFKMVKVRTAYARVKIWKRYLIRKYIIVVSK